MFTLNGITQPANELVMLDFAFVQKISGAEGQGLAVDITLAYACHNH